MTKAIKLVLYEFSGSVLVSLGITDETNGSLMMMAIKKGAYICLVAAPQSESMILCARFIFTVKNFHTKDYPLQEDFCFTFLIWRK